LRKTVENLNIPHINSQTSPHVTISLGVATVLPGSVASVKELIQMADESLYTAKKEGRNRTVVHH